MAYISQSNNTQYRMILSMIGTIHKLFVFLPAKKIGGKFCFKSNTGKQISVSGGIKDTLCVLDKYGNRYDWYMLKLQNFTILFPSNQYTIAYMVKRLNSKMYNKLGRPTKMYYDPETNKFKPNVSITPALCDKKVKSGTEP